MLFIFNWNYFSKYILNFMPPTPSNKLGQGQQRTGKVVEGLLEHSTVIEVIGDSIMIGYKKGRL